MSEQHTYRATIPGIEKTTSRPLWSVMIPTYNCANYLRETLASVLEQDPGPDVMQIEVIDDHSTKDDPKAVVEELGQGRVRFYQQSQNVGYLRSCTSVSKGLPKKEKSERKGVIKIQLNGYGNHCSTRPRISV